MYSESGNDYSILPRVRRVRGEIRNSVETSVVNNLIDTPTASCVLFFANKKRPSWRLYHMTAKASQVRSILSSNLQTNVAHYYDSASPGATKSKAMTIRAQRRFAKNVNQKRVGGPGPTDHMARDRRKIKKRQYFRVSSYVFTYFQRGQVTHSMIRTWDMFLMEKDTDLSIIFHIICAFGIFCCWNQECSSCIWVGNETAESRALLHGYVRIRRQCPGNSLFMHR